MRRTGPQHGGRGITGWGGDGDWAGCTGGGAKGGDWEEARRGLGLREDWGIRLGLRAGQLPPGSGLLETCQVDWGGGTGPSWAKRRLELGSFFWRAENGVRIGSKIYEPARLTHEPRAIFPALAESQCSSSVDQAPRCGS